MGGRQAVEKIRGDVDEWIDKPTGVARREKTRIRQGEQVVPYRLSSPKGGKSAVGKARRYARVSGVRVRASPKHSGKTRKIYILVQKTRTHHHASFVEQIIFLLAIGLTHSQEKILSIVGRVLHLTLPHQHRNLLLAHVRPLKR